MLVFCFQDNWDVIVKRWGQGMVFHHFIRDIVTPVSNLMPCNFYLTYDYVNTCLVSDWNMCWFQFSSNEKAEEVEEFFGSRVSPSFSRNLKQSIEQIRIKAKWIEKVRKEESLIPKLARGLTRSPMLT